MKVGLVSIILGLVIGMTANAEEKTKTIATCGDWKVVQMSASGYVVGFDKSAGLAPLVVDKESQDEGVLNLKGKFNDTNDVQVVYDENNGAAAIIISDSITKIPNSVFRADRCK